jgi:serine/threonine-protein kinase
VEYIGQWVSCKYCDRQFLAGEAAGPDDLETVRAERDHLRRLIASLRGVLEAAHGRHQAEADRVPASTGGVPSSGGNGFAGDAPLLIPGFEVLGTLSEGAMGRLYRARQSSLGRVVAVKVLDASLARSPEFRIRFRREARLSAELSHPNLITTIDAGEVDGQPYYVMEFVDGSTVEDVLARQPVFEEADAVRIALAVAEALQYLHDHGLLHRDIKPANVILTSAGGVKLADLGLAWSSGDDELAAAEEGKAIGTPEYISPEQVNGHVEPDIRSDLYSLGAMLYRMATGRLPFAGATAREVMRKHADRTTPLVPPQEVNPAISSGLNELVLKLLARDRDQRYRDPAELVAALQALRDANRDALPEPAPRFSTAPDEI